MIIWKRSVSITVGAVTYVVWWRGRFEPVPFGICGKGVSWKPGLMSFLIITIVTCLVNRYSRKWVMSWYLRRIGHVARQRGRGAGSEDMLYVSATCVRVSGLCDVADPCCICRYLCRCCVFFTVGCPALCFIWNCIVNILQDAVTYLVWW